MELYYTILNSKTIADFEINYRQVKKASLQLTGYLSRYWLNNHAQKLISCYTNRITHFGLTTTSKAEGAHRTIKD
ncbi:hypothetical protein K469DRAFT_546552 [Zopfia rhizophila CBS 207.26]|uniref:Uncharacterized protein n=1 Tax=Zopfia rhizophila CBS 207.26 TaxID=1314779 RepID=A0A6A6EWB3_9PEZI|nr:hypothetical protein K469DRAFT_546552 [Zopfia rhizophila CBS 207.26]